MNKEKHVVPKLRFPEFEDEWNEKILENLCFKISDGIHSTPKYDNKGEYYFVNGNNLINGIIVINKSTKRVSKEEFEKHKRELGSNTILLSINGTIGNLSEYSNEKVVLGKSACYINVDEGIVNKKFILLSLKTESIRNYFYSELTGSTIKNLSLKTIKNTVIKLPNPKEQQKIANCLSSLDKLITAETEKLEHLKDHKKGLLQQLFPAKGETKPQFRFPEFKNDGDWEITTLGKIAKFRRGSFPQPYGRPEWYDDENGMPFIQVYDVDTNLKIKPKTKRRISALAAEKSVFIPEGTVIITIQGSIGRVAITQYDAYIDRTLLLFEEFYKPIDKLFFAYVIQLLFEIEKEKAPGGIIKTITKEVLTSFNIYVPDVLEQQKIAKCLSSLDDLITAQTQKIKALKNHKKGLLQQLFPTIKE